MYNVEKRSDDLENAARFVRQDAYIYIPVTKWQYWDMFIHWENKLGVPPNAVQVKMPLALVSSCMAGIRRCPVSSARSAQNLVRRITKRKTMKR